MKRISYGESQIIGILKEAESGIPVPELCRKHGMGNSTFYKWRSRYGGMDVSLLQRMKELESENKRLKKLYAESQLEADIIREALRKKW
jgi:putative transposase